MGRSAVRRERHHYALRHLPGHLIDRGDHDRLCTLLSSLVFLEGKCEGVSVFALASDLRRAGEVLPEQHPSARILRLLEEALRRDLHFLDRHPSTLLQCLWNTGWWYSCPEREEHYEPAEDDAEGTGDDPELHLLLERWRRQKEQSGCRGLWLRTLRPPRLPLGSALEGVLRGHTDMVLNAAVSADGSRIVTSSTDDSIWAWDAVSQEVLLRIQLAEDEFGVIALSPDGEWIFAASDPGLVRSWDALTGASGRAYQGHEEPVVGVALSRDGQRLASGSQNGTIRLWDLQTGMETGHLAGHEDWVRSIAFSSDGRFLVSGSGDRSVRIWEVQHLTETQHMEGHEVDVLQVAFTPDASRVVSVDFDVMKIWDLSSGECLRTITGRGDAAALARALSEPGPQLIALSLPLGTEVQEVATGRAVAWYPTSFQCIASSAREARWVGADHSHLQIIRLESWGPEGD